MVVEVIASFSRSVAADLLSKRPRFYTLDRHLREAEAWLVRAHDATPDDGVSYGYSLRGGWLPSYRETSGYIAPTFFNLAAHREEPSYRERAVRIARWLVSVQNADGSFANPRYGSSGIVFDTGQDLLGLVRAYRETKDAFFLDAARRAGRWLVGIADRAGRWTANEHFGTPHVYNTRTAWGLLQLDQVDPDREYVHVARANLDWAVSEQRNGYFAHCAFRPGAAAFTHTIAYTIRGLLESGRLLQDDGYKECADVAARTMLAHLRGDGFMPGQIDERGIERASYCCLTGNCQLAISWAKLHESTGHEPFRDATIRALSYVMACQDIDTSDLNVRGGIKGSQPIWGRYAPLSYPNWATKFFIDAMLLRNRWMT